MKKITKNEAEMNEALSAVSAGGEATLGQQEFRKDTMLTRSQKRMIFYILMMILPVLQLAIFYFYVNFNSIILAFRSFDLVNTETGFKYVSRFAGFENFKNGWWIFTGEGVQMILNSLKLYLVNLLIVMSLALVFSYYIAKKFMLAGFFRVVLYLPHIISSVVLTLLFKYIVTDVYSEIMQRLTGQEFVAGLLDGDADKQYLTIMFYCVWLGFGTNVMLYTNAMSGIDPSIVESAQLDGVNIINEFLHIYFPLIYPTFVIFVVTGMTSIFSDQMQLFTFYGYRGTNFDVFGYYLYRNTFNGDMYAKSATGLSYPELSALGLIITAVLCPVTLIVRYFLEKFGPSTD